jgi:hypothetical protein
MALLILLNNSTDAVDPLSAFLGLMKSVDCTPSAASVSSALVIALSALTVAPTAAEIRAIAFSLSVLIKVMSFLLCVDMLKNAINPSLMTITLCQTYYNKSIDKLTDWHK